MGWMECAGNPRNCDVFHRKISRTESIRSVPVVVSRNTPPALPQAVCPTMKRRTSCTQRPKSRMPMPRTTCASTFSVMFGGKQGHYARWHVHLWVSLPCRLSPVAELGVWCFTVNGVEYVTPSDSHHLLMTSVWL